MYSDMYFKMTSFYSRVVTLLTLKWFDTWNHKFNINLILLTLELFDTWNHKFINLTINIKIVKLLAFIDHQFSLLPIQLNGGTICLFPNNCQIWNYFFHKFIQFYNTVLEWLKLKLMKSKESSLWYRPIFTLHKNYMRFGQSKLAQWFRSRRLCPSRRTCRTNMATIWLYLSCGGTNINFWPGQKT